VRLALLVCLVFGADAVPAAVLTPEDVVRMHVAGTDAETIIDEIRSSGGSFELDDEMVVELRAAGLPPAVIEAMLARSPVPASIEEPASTAPLPERRAATLRILLNPARDPAKPERLRLSVRIDVELRTALGLHRSTEGSWIQDLAIFVACLSSTHVPDHWRSKSALGRDFNRMPRHTELLFVGNAKRDENKDGTVQLELEIPEALDVELEPAIPHDLMLGVAVRIDDRYYLIASERRDDIVLDAPRALGATITSGRRNASLGQIEVHFEEPAPPTP
jgi:hypothetical protein